MKMNSHDDSPYKRVSRPACVPGCDISHLGTHPRDRSIHRRQNKRVRYHGRQASPSRRCAEQCRPRCSSRRGPTDLLRRLVVSGRFWVQPHPKKDLVPTDFLTSQNSGQCGGTGFSGSTCCASGSVCSYSNEYYSQCLPGTASSSSAAVTSATTSSKASASSTAASTSTKATTSTSSVAATTTKATGTATGAASTASYSGNPFSGVQQWANSYYASEISAYAIPTLAAAQASKAAEVAKVPTFQWL